MSGEDKDEIIDQDKDVDLQKNKRAFAWVSFIAIFIIACISVYKGQTTTTELCLMIFASLTGTYMGLSTAADYFSKKGGK